MASSTGAWPSGRACSLAPKSVWLLYRVADHPDCSVDEVARRVKADPGIIEPGIVGLEEAGLVVGKDGAGPEDTRQLQLTPDGESAVARLVEARHKGLTELLDGWDLDTNTEVVAMVRQLAGELLADDEKMLAAAGLHGTA